MISDLCLISLFGHSHEMGRVKTTKSRRPVKLIYKEELEDYKEARKRELYLKSGTGRDWLRATMEGCQSGCDIRHPGTFGLFSITYRFYKIFAILCILSISVFSVFSAVFCYKNVIVRGGNPCH